MRVKRGLPLFMFLCCCRVALVAQEARAELGLSDVAGVYYGDGRPLRLCRLEISVDGGYSQTYFERSTMTKWRQGRVHLGGNCVALLDPRSPLRFVPGDSVCDLAGGASVVDRDHLPCVIMRFVRWGSRRYLLDRGQLSPFCIATAEKVEPRQKRQGSFYLQEGDEARATASVPPAECQKDFE